MDGGASTVGQGAGSGRLMGLEGSAGPAGPVVLGSPGPSMDGDAAGGGPADEGDTVEEEEGEELDVAPELCLAS